MGFIIDNDHISTHLSSRTWQKKLQLNSNNSNCIYIRTYTGCPRRNMKYFGRVFLMLNYTDITQNTYIQS